MSGLIGRTPSLNKLQLETYQQELIAEEKEMSDVLGYHVVVDSLPGRKLNSYSSRLDRVAIRERRHRLGRARDNEVTQRVIKRKLDAHSESMDLTTMSTGKADFEADRENLADFLPNELTFVDAGNSKAVDVGFVSTKKLDNFFERPILLLSVPLLVGSPFDQELLIWNLYMAEPSVRAKLRNYAFVRGDLEVTIVVSGTPFHYGKILASYQPYPFLNEALSAMLGMFVVSTDIRQALLAYMSQAPGATVIDVKENKPVVLHVPFILHKPMARLFNSSSAAISAATPFSDFDDMGSLMIWSLNDINSVAASPSSAHMSVYARMVNVEVSGLTGTHLEVTTESRDFDERKTGPVEKVASNVGAAFNTLISVPIIGPYARASSIIATGISRIAAIFGWSKPTVDMKPQSVKNLGSQSTTQAIGYDTSLKLSYDIHQETSVDPRVCGSGEDEMVIAHVNARQSYAGYFTWATADVPFTTVLTRIAVNPGLAVKATHSTKTYAVPTALGFASQLFTFWRGDITYKFEVVCSAYHRGRLAIIYEPDVPQNVIISAATEMNKQFLKVIDIADTQSIEVTVRWCNDYPWLRVFHLSSMETVDLSVNSTAHHSNGFIYVVVLNALTSPDDSPVSVNVYQKSDDMSYNLLTHSGIPSERIIYTESRDLSSTVITSVDLNESTANKQGLSEIYFGEQPLSFRAILKRFNTVGTMSRVTTAPPSTTQFVVNNIPVIDPPFSTISSRVYATFISYLRPAYLGLRGSVRFKFRVLTTLTTGDNQAVTVGNENIAAYTINTSSSGTTNSMTINPLGDQLFYLNSNAGVEYELPFYTDNSYVYAFNSELGQDSDFADGGVFNEAWVRMHRVKIYSDMPNATNIVTMQDWAAGEDFALFRFQGAPYFSYNT